MCVPTALSCVWFFVTPWTVALQAPLSMEFSRWEYWSGLSFPTPGYVYIELIHFIVQQKLTQYFNSVYVSRSIMSDSLWPRELQPTRLLCPWNSPGKNTGLGCHSLLQGIFPTQGSDLSHMSPALADGFFTTSATWEAPINFRCQVNSRFKKNYSLGI